MLITETKIINGRELIHTYSDAKMMIERDGILYINAYDPIETNRTYIETTTPIKVIEPKEDKKIRSLKKRRKFKNILE